MIAPVAVSQAPSSNLASSSNMTGMSSRIGKTRRQALHSRPLSSSLSVTGTLQAGQTSNASSSAEIAIVKSCQAAFFISSRAAAITSRNFRARSVKIS